MKMTFNIRTAAAAALLVVGASSCTKNFKDYNTDPAALTDGQSTSLLPSVFGVMAQNIYHNYQTAVNLNCDGYAGYYTSPNPFSASNDQNYGLKDSWDAGGFTDQYTYVMAPVAKMRQLNLITTHPDAWAIALILQVDAMDRVTDRFGPIPYSKAGTSVSAIPYDSQQQIYNEFFAQLDTAVSLLTAADTTTLAASWLGASDLVYGTSAKPDAQWLKFANSLRLRLAMRISKIDGVTAKLQGEKALGDPGGLMSTPADDALFQQSGGRNNDVWTVAASYGDCRMGAALMTYMNGYNDPRLPKYATPATAPASIAGTYTGIRIGSDKIVKNDYIGFSSPNTNTGQAFAQTAPQYLMTAAEVWFLKAEAALRGWTNSGTAQTDYETGIQTSMTQWGVSIGNYLSDNSSKEANFTDPVNSENSINALSTMTIAWDNSLTQEQQLEKIITQKWIAIYPDGIEAWDDYRRTGYPQLFPVYLNTSGGTISTTTQIRRLALPVIEYTNNAAAVQAAVANYLNGPDNGGTRLWWDTGGANF